MLPLSHDEVVHLKKPLLGKMPGPDDAARFANLRALYAWMWAHPGKQLLFMGGELADPNEWSHERGARLEPRSHDPRHAGVQRLVGDLNAIQAHHPALFTLRRRPGRLRVARRRRRRAERPRLRAAAARARTTSSCASPTSRASTPRTTGSAWPGPGRWRGLVTTDDARYGGSGSWVPHLDAEPTAVAGPRATPPCSPSRPSPCSTSSRDGLTADLWCCTGTSTNRRGRTRGRVRCPSSPTRRRSTTGTSASPPSATRPTRRWRSPATTASRSWSAPSSTCRSTWAPPCCRGSRRTTPTCTRRILAADAAAGRAIAQAYGHAILPLCNEHDLRTQVRWGIVDFVHRFGRRARRRCGCPRPRSATPCCWCSRRRGSASRSSRPGQIEAVRPLGADDAAWEPR